MGFFLSEGLKMILGDSGKICEEMKKIYPKKFAAEEEILVIFTAETGSSSIRPAVNLNI